MAETTQKIIRQNSAITQKPKVVLQLGMSPMASNVSGDLVGMNKLAKNFINEIEECFLSRLVAGRIFLITDTPKKNYI